MAGTARRRPGRALQSLLRASDITIGAGRKQRGGRTRLRDRIADLPKAANVVDTLITPADERHVTVLETAVAPGGSGGSTLYTLPSECEMCFVVQGAVEVQVEDRHFSLEAGDALTFGAAVPHSWKAPSDGARTLWILAPDPQKGIRWRDEPPMSRVIPRFVPDAGAAPDTSTGARSRVPPYRASPATGRRNPECPLTLTAAATAPSAMATPQPGHPEHGAPLR